MNYSKESLNSVTGKVISIDNIVTKIINKPAYRRKKTELRIVLENHDGYFRLTDNYRYENILQVVKKGSNLTIYTRPKYLVPIGMGKQNDIYQMELNDSVLFSIKHRNRNSKKLIWTSSIFLGIFGSAYFFSKRKLSINNR